MSVLNEEAWKSDFQETLNLDAAFLKRMTDLTEFATKSMIHFPNAGSLTKAMDKNLATPYTTVEQRTDTLVNIAIDRYSHTPVLITDLETFQVTADKRNSIMGQKNREVIEDAANTVFAKIGASVDAAHTLTYNGALTFEDIVTIQKMFDMDNIPQADRSLELNVEQFYDLVLDPKILPMYSSGLSVVQNADFVQVAGLKVYKRPTITTIGGKAAALAYHKGCVGAAVTDMKTFYRANDPFYQGDVISNALWLGAGVLRTDKKGVIAIVKGA